MLEQVKSSLKCYNDLANINVTAADYVSSNERSDIISHVHKLHAD
jgi:hypothetical protein